MRNLLKAELRKTLKSRLFLLSLVIGCVMALITFAQAFNRYYYSDLSILKNIEDMERTGQSRDIYIGSQTLYNQWMGGNRYSLGSSLFFALAPILAALPNGWSFSEELYSGYLTEITPKKGRRAYFLSKLAASFVSGGLTIIIPLLFNVLLTALTIPAIAPNPLYSAYFGLARGTVLSVMFYTHPLAAIGLMLFIDFLFGGLFAWLSLTTALFVRARTATVIVPYLILTFSGMGQSFLYYTTYISIAPLDMLHPFSTTNYVYWPVLLIWMTILVIVTAPIIIVKGCRYEIT